MDPLTLFDSDRSRARGAEDPMAHLCTIANVDADGKAQIRTLVLRDVDDRLAVFVNATSPKWQHLQSGFVLHTYWPSVQVQYRMHVRAELLDVQLVHDSWHLRPDTPKRMDWFYEHYGEQSSPIESRQALLAKLGSLNLPNPLRAPDNARGLLLDPFEIERLDLTQPEGVHDRQLFTRADNVWQRSTLVP